MGISEELMHMWQTEGRVETTSCQIIDKQHYVRMTEDTVFVRYLEVTKETHWRETAVQETVVLATHPHTHSSPGQKHIGGRLQYRRLQYWLPPTHTHSSPGQRHTV